MYENIKASWRTRSHAGVYYMPRARASYVSVRAFVYVKIDTEM